MADDGVCVWTKSAEKYNGYGFQLDQAIVKETIKKKVNLLNLDVPLKTLPMTVTTLSSDVLERKNILNLEDAVRFYRELR